MRHRPRRAVGVDFGVPAPVRTKPVRAAPPGPPSGAGEMVSAQVQGADAGAGRSGRLHAESRVGADQFADRAAAKRLRLFWVFSITWPARGRPARCRTGPSPFTCRPCVRSRMICRKIIRAPLADLGFDEPCESGMANRATPRRRSGRRNGANRPPHRSSPRRRAWRCCSAKRVAEDERSRIAALLVVDEIHALGGKQTRHAPDGQRGTAGSAGLPRRFAASGLSATIAPLEKVAQFLTGPQRPCHFVTATANRKAIVEVFSPLRKNPYPPAALHRNPCAEGNWASC